MGTRHSLGVGSFNHAVTANPNAAGTSYANIAARDADSAFHSATTNINKVIRVETPLAFFILAAIAPTWVEFGAANTTLFTALTDTPASISANLVYQGNAAGTALVQGQDLRTVGSPTFADVEIDGGITFTDNTKTLFVSKIQHVAGANLAIIGAVSGISLDLTSALGALRLNRLTTTQRDALTPQQGMTIFNTTTNQVEDYNGTAWVGTTASDEWTELTDTPASITANFVVQGNAAGTALEFGQALDTTDNPAFNNLIVSGTLGVGIVSPSEKLVVASTVGGTPVIARVEHTIAVNADVTQGLHLMKDLLGSDFGWKIESSGLLDGDSTLKFIGSAGGGGDTTHMILTRALGFLGLGISPTAKLHVAGDAIITGNLTVAGTTTTQPMRFNC